ncbi:MAG: hypothetical protein IEMM0002_0721 [bacterium]|nr:MAG: hypothetical protein IEMM0002_0721 [bacterium]
MVVKTEKTANMLVRLENLDQLLLLAGEVIIASSNLSILHRNLQNLHDAGDRVSSDTLESMNDLAGTTSEISSNLHQLVQSIRMVDLKDLGFRARRLVRDISRKTGKRVVFEFEGEETTVDKTIIEKIHDPISHQMRNAIDHGIEDSLTRRKNGKSEEGHITIRAYNSENETFIDIEDDGAGVNMEALRQRGIEQGVLAEDDPFSEADALELMCTPGVSTAESVSQVSGRGVGMDVVRRSIIDMGGTVSFQTMPGVGTTFTFRVPLISAVNIVDALVVSSGKHMFAFPIASVVTTMSIPHDEVETTLEKAEMVMYLDRLLPLHDLNTVLKGARADYNGDMVSVLVIEHKGETVAFRITEFLSPQKLVIIPFDGALDVEGISGTTILGGRRLGFIIDPPALIDRATGKRFMRYHKKSSVNGGRNLTDENGSEAQELQAETVEPNTKSGAEKLDATSATDDAVVKEFIGEIEKIFPSLNEALFALESDPSNSEQMNTTFRLFHTIKGNFMMMGLPRGGETIHSVESVLDRARGRKLEITPEVMDVLMDGASYIEEVIRQSAAGTWQDAASSEILEQSTRLLPEQRGEQRESMDVASEEITFSHASSYRMNLYRKRKMPFYRCYIEFDSGKQPPFLIACLMYKRICELGDVLGTVPRLVDIERGMMDGKFKLLFASEVDADKLEKALVKIFTNYYGATMVKLGRFE